MSGHSKWATIKRQKGKTDAQRGKIFTKIGREIAVAVKNGGSDPAMNPRLRDAVNKAKTNNMPSDNIARSIKKAAGELGSINYEAIIYEGYGPFGTAVIVECLTDNKNRTAGEVRHIFDKAGGAMGTTGCVSYLFESRALIEVEKAVGVDEDEAMMAAVECGADDFSVEDGYFEIVAAAGKLDAVKAGLTDAGYNVLNAETNKIPATWIALDGEAAIKVQKMLDALDDNDDVQQVFHNAQLPEEEGE
ncbi:MAG: YebC/PmpR family DNA-binding transcriptional regulator [Firmicutes bacterium]|nr:YebC/PmpR family DNA-binding transcriptional regulator [Bacillota bacterium]